MSWIYSAGLFAAASQPKSTVSGTIQFSVSSSASLKVLNRVSGSIQLNLIALGTLKNLNKIQGAIPLSIPSISGSLLVLPPADNVFGAIVFRPTITGTFKAPIKVSGSIPLVHPIFTGKVHVQEIPFLTRMLPSAFKQAKRRNKASIKTSDRNYISGR